MTTPFQQARAKKDPQARHLRDSHPLYGRTPPRGKGDPFNCNLKPQFEAWGATSVYPFGPDQVAPHSWSWQEGSAMCLMPDGRWYWGHATYSGGAYMSVGREDGIVAQSGREALARHLVRGLERSIASAATMLAGQQKLLKAEQKKVANAVRAAARTKSPKRAKRAKRAPSASRPKARAKRKA